MTLRHQVSLILPFGSRSVLTQCFALVLDALTLRSRLLAALLLSATLATLVQFNFRFKALRHRGFPGFALYRSTFIIALFTSEFNHSLVLKIDSTVIPQRRRGSV